MAGDEPVPVGIERAHIDAALAHGIEHVAGGHEIAVHLGIQRRSLARAVGEQMMAEGVEARMRVRDRPACASAEGVLEAPVVRVLTHDQIGAVHRPTGRPRRTRNRRGKRHDRGELERDRIAAHEHRAQIGT